MPSFSSALNLSQNQGLFQWVSCLSGYQNTGALASTSVLPMSTRGWFPSRLTGLISMPSEGRSGVHHHSSKAWIHRCSAFFYSLALKTVNDHWEDHSLGYPDFARRVTFLLFNTLSRFVIAFLPRNNLLLISWLQSPSTVILETEERKSVTTSTFSPSAAAAAKSLQSCPTLCNPIDGSPPGSAVPGILQARTLICYKMMGLDAIILVLVLSQLFHSPPSPSPRGSLVPLQFLPLEWCHLHFWGCWCFSCLSWFQLVTQSAWHFSPGALFIG